MEVEIDPLSMLEQSMQVNEGYSVGSNAEEEVMVLEDQSMQVQAVEPTPALAPEYYQANGRLLLQTDVSLQEAAFGFGEHFLISQTPEYGSTLLSGSPMHQQDLPSPPPLTWRGSGRGRGSRGSRATRGSSRARGRGRIGPTSSKQPQQQSQSQLQQQQQHRLQIHAVVKQTNENAAFANSKLVSNVKRLSFASSEELNYRQKIFGDLGKVLNSRLDCTVCGQHIGCTAQMNVFLVTHPLLKVMACIQCRENYCSTDWTLGPDHKDIRCRWCSKPSSHRSILHNCTNCPFAFCEACIVRNYSKRDWNKIAMNENWLCYVCQMVPLFFMRATCWALQMFVASLNRRKNQDVYRKDLSRCCKGDVDTIDLVDETDTAESGTEPNGSHPVIAIVSVLPVSSRIDLMFNGIERIKQSVRTRLSFPVDASKIDSLVSDLNMSLAKIGTNLESCLDYIENWRSHTSESLKHKDVNETKTICEKRMNGSRDYSHLLRKFNIKPCRVVLERLDPSTIRTETSQPPSFFLSLVPQQLAIESKCPPKQTPSNNISILDDSDDEIICLDD